MPKSRWKAFPYPEADYEYSGVALRNHWQRLHCGDCEGFPDEALLRRLIATSPELEPTGPLDKAVSHLRDAWRAYHRGDFGEAVAQGLAVGRLGYNVANKAANIYATYLAPNPGAARALYKETVLRAEELQECAPKLPNAWYFHAQALGRHSQSISITEALAEGLATKVKSSLDRTIALEPRHADAHIAFGTYHAEIVNKVGGLVGSLVYGASRDAAVKNFDAALRLNPLSAIARIEYAEALTSLFGRKLADKVAHLYADAAAHHPVDAMERFDCELAKERVAR
jgi:hypothetical protein